jgi:hypothetical protein
MLNRGCRKYGDERDWPFRRCQFRESKNTLALQLTDVILGSLAYRLNGHHLAFDASPAKTESPEKRLAVLDPVIGATAFGRGHCLRSSFGLPETLHTAIRGQIVNPPCQGFFGLPLLGRAEVRLANIPPCLIGMEPCVGAAFLQSRNSLSRWDRLGLP